VSVPASVAAAGVFWTVRHCECRMCDCTGPSAYAGQPLTGTVGAACVTCLLLAPVVLPAGWQTARRGCGHTLAQQVGGWEDIWVGGWMDATCCSSAAALWRSPAASHPALAQVCLVQQRLKPDPTDCPCYVETKEAPPKESPGGTMAGNAPFGQGVRHPADAPDPRIGQYRGARMPGWVEFVDWWVGSGSG
jgi:hypothetical protein